MKFASVKLAKKYMKRVATELQSMGASNKDPALEYMMLQGVRFAFRIHQVRMRKVLSMNLYGSFSLLFMRCLNSSMIDSFTSKQLKYSSENLVLCRLFLSDETTILVSAISDQKKVELLSVKNFSLLFMRRLNSSMIDRFTIKQLKYSCENLVLCRLVLADETTILVSAISDQKNKVESLSVKE